MRLASILLSEFVLHKAMPSWFEAATLIITAPTNTNLIKTANEKCDYDVLMLKRSSKSSFYPNAYVFPGGRVDKADLSEKWIDIYKLFDPQYESLFDRLKINQGDNNRSPMFDYNATDHIPKEIAYRICAIRETFEETGILLTRNFKNKNFSSRYSDVHQFPNSKNIQKWRKRVHGDAYQFVDMCKEFKCIPDVWSLHEWSNWLTPSEMFQKMSKRYDTVFYTANIPSVPEFAEQDNMETVEITWDTPESNLDVFRLRKGVYGPPQIYELLRLANFNTHQQFIEFSYNRGLKGMERWLPIRAVTKDNIGLSLYPGDQWYPKDITKETVKAGPIEINMTYSDMLKVPPSNHNHMKLLDGLFDWEIACSYPALYGHCNPKPIKISQNKAAKL